MLDVSVILINYNTSKYTLESIEKVREHTNTKISYKIVVVDNCSETTDFQYLLKNFPKHEDISLHKTTKNLGFGGGNMYGADFVSNSKYSLFLNNDAMLLNDCLSILVTYMEKNPNVGVCTAQNYNEHLEFVPSFDHNKGLRRLLFGRGFLEKTNPKKYPKQLKEYKNPLVVNWVNGAFLFFRTEAFNEVNGFDTNIFLYWEEMDICHRLKKKRYQSTLVPEAKILHYQGLSTGTFKAISKEAYISYLYVIKKNFGTLKYQIIRSYLTIALSLKKKKRYLVPTVTAKDPMNNSLKHLQKNRDNEARN
tara:strand:+ start:1506 stop:2426 length:921 start_codon:yes stop_codon:yes gene_type:complete